MRELEYLQSKYAIKDSVRQEIGKNIVDIFSSDVSREKRPKVFILGAQPGAGKTELEKHALIESNANAVICNVDNLKMFYPRAEEIMKEFPEEFSSFVGPFAHQWNLDLRNHCIQNQYNFVLETTFSNSDNINIIIQKLKNNNYDVNIMILACPPQLSKISIYERYERAIEDNRVERKIDPIEHDQRFSLISKTILSVEKEHLFDYISLYGRNITNLNMDDSSGIYKIAESTKSIYKDYIAETSQNLIPKCQELINAKIEYVLKRLIERKAPKEEINSFTDIFDISSFIKNQKGFKL